MLCPVLNKAKGVSSLIGSSVHRPRPPSLAVNPILWVGMALTRKGLLAAKGRWEASCLCFTTYPLSNVPCNKVSSGIYKPCLHEAQENRQVLAKYMQIMCNLYRSQFNFAWKGSPVNGSLGPNGWLDSKGNAICLAVPRGGGLLFAGCTRAPCMPNCPSQERLSNRICPKSRQQASQARSKLVQYSFDALRFVCEIMIQVKTVE